MNHDFAPLLLGKDLRTISANSIVVQSVHEQSEFDDLFPLIFHHERTLAMRAADAVEKITRTKPHFLQPHKQQLKSLIKGAINIEMKWHLAQLMPRLSLESFELKEIWDILLYWVLNPNESKIVRVNALQALFDLSEIRPALKNNFRALLDKVSHEPIPSIQARVRKLKKKSH